MKDILDLKLPKNDARAKTVREFLRCLLSTLWEEEEGFSGKRPFGNSGWKHVVYEAMIKAKVVSGKLDADGYIETVNYDEADTLIQDAIGRLR